MKRRQLIGLIACVSLCCFSTSALLGASAVMTMVPDWDQPQDYPLPTGPPAGSYPNWCSASAGGNIMGYWEDVKGKTGLADQSAAAAPFNPPFNYPGNPGTWQQNLFLDGAIEMGWYMDTGKWVSFPRGFPPNVGVTNNPNINPGLTNYAQTGWVDASAAGLTKTAYQATVTTDAFNDPKTLAAIWTKYKSEIDAGRPVEVSFDMWVDATAPISNHVINGTTAVEYAWNPLLSMGHSVVGVGYVDNNVGVMGLPNNDWFIVQDNWPNTARYVAAPLVDPIPPGATWNFQGVQGPTVWRQNDYVTIGDRITHEYIPEPATMILTALALTGLAGYCRRRKLAA